MYLAYHLIASAAFLAPCLADVQPFFNDDKFDKGEYGKYVTQSFKSNSHIKTPILNINKPFTDCDDGSYLFIAPRGTLADSTPMILDPTGSPIWAAPQPYGEVYNLQVQQYKGESFLTFWAGNDAVGGHGAGKYYMLDKHYNERFKISAANGLAADLHTFDLTDDDTALSSVYTRKEVDIPMLTDGRTRGWIWDSAFQELDLETGEALFEWRAADHFELSESFTKPNAATQADPWDVWHINSIQKDRLGNYLLSFRFLRCVAYVDGRTGEVRWRLGGARNSFTDLSDGDATTFVGQHDAHLSANGVYLTLFDNRADWYQAVEPRSRGKRIELNAMAMTARLDAAFVHPSRDILSFSQGSYQTLPNGNVLIGYGFNGAMTEFSPDGQHALCDAYFEPASEFGSGNVQSYRNLKFNWTGLPDTNPDLALHRDALYVSWNGATEVRAWLFQDADIDQDINSFEDVLSIGKVGFESQLPLVDNIAFRRLVRVVGVDADGNRLGKSKAVDIGDLARFGEAVDAGEASDVESDLLKEISGTLEAADNRIQSHVDENPTGEHTVETVPPASHSEEEAEESTAADEEDLEEGLEEEEVDKGAADEGKAKPVDDEEEDKVVDNEDEDEDDFDDDSDFGILCALGLLALLSVLLVICMAVGSRWMLRPFQALSSEKSQHYRELDSLWQRVRAALSWRRRRRREVVDVAATESLMADVDDALEKGDGGSCRSPA